jgi:hypothetical protein
MAISVTKYMVKDDLSAIEFDVQVSAGQTVAKILLWNESTYKDPATAVNLTSLLDGSGNTESIEISAASVGASQLKGIYFLEITSSDSEAAVVATFNMTRYYTIQAKLIASIDISCLNCNSNFQNALLFDMYLEATKQSLLLGRYRDAISNLEHMNTSIDYSSCDNCLEEDMSYESSISLGVDNGGSNNNNDGTNNSGYIPNITNSDKDGDGVNDDVDLDDDNDGILDIEEANGDIDRDTDRDGDVEIVDLDSDNDGASDVLEAGFTDADGDGRVDGSGVAADGTIIGSDGYITPLDVDNNSTPDFQEAGPDSDGDGIPDATDPD